MTRILYTALIISEKAFYAPQTVPLSRFALRLMEVLKVMGSTALELCISVGISNSCMSGVRNFGIVMGMTLRSLRADIE